MFFFTCALVSISPGNLATKKLYSKGYSASNNSFHQQDNCLASHIGLSSLPVVRCFDTKILAGLIQSINWIRQIIVHWMILSSNQSTINYY